MGEQNIRQHLSTTQLRLFTKCLLDDVHALEKLLESDLVERGVRRIGAEQELFLIDRTGRPAPVNMEVLERLGGGPFTHELGRFNIEINLDPMLFGGSCLSQLEQQLARRVEQVRVAAAEVGADLAMTGILPTLEQTDLSLENMTPVPRYAALNRILTDMRGGDYEFVLQGTDELVWAHDSVMVEAANTSFQVHFQTAPEEFARLYNMAQVASGPVLAASCNAPLLFGKRLWRETRIALFQQSIDTRGAQDHRRNTPPRVSFGQDWLQESVLEIFREDIARFKILFGMDDIEDPFEALNEGRPPRLRALSLHNGTVYRWNRACYGVSDAGMAHIRIEARFLPAGPTVIDEVANAAFWFGILSGLLEEHDDIRKAIRFEHAKTNFFDAARAGIDAQIVWLDGKVRPARDVILDQMLPLARHGLTAAEIEGDDIDRYLGVIEERVRCRQTGSVWLLQSLDHFADQGTREQRMRALTSASATRCRDGIPVHQWTLAELDEAGEWRESHHYVSQFMNTDLITVEGHEPIDLVINLIEWKGIRYVLVEDEAHHLVGLVSSRMIIRYLARNQGGAKREPEPITTIMRTDLITATPETETLEAIELMKSGGIGCLPIIRDGLLVGVVTEADLSNIAKQLIEASLRV